MEEVRPRTVELVLLRHAHAVAKADRDLDRPLTKDGTSDAQQVGRLLATAGLRPDLVLASPAVRALHTSELALSAWTPAPPLQVEPRIYDASAETLLGLVSKAGGAHRRLLVVGHNPGLSELAAWLAAVPPGWSLGKGAAAHLRLRATWKDMARGCGRLVDVLQEM